MGFAMLDNLLFGNLFCFLISLFLLIYLETKCLSDIEVNWLYELQFIHSSLNNKCINVQQKTPFTINNWKDNCMYYTTYTRTSTYISGNVLKGVCITLICPPWSTWSKRMNKIYKGSWPSWPLLTHTWLIEEI